MRAHGWTWREPGYEIDLPMPLLSAPAQIENAAAAIAALRALDLEISKKAIAAGIGKARPPGRLQVLREHPELVLDVGHNPQAADQLAAWLQAHPRRTRAVFSALRDKDIAGVVRALAGRITRWHLATLGGPRGTSAADLAAILVAAGVRSPVDLHETPAQAFEAAREQAGEADKIAVFGSFHTVAEVMQHLSAKRSPGNR